MADEPHHGEDEPRRSGSVTDGELSRGFARQVRGMRPGHLEGDLRSRVARANHQNGAFLELRWVAVLAGMELHDARMELTGEGGDLRYLVGARRDDHVFRFETAVAGCNYEPISLPGESVHLDAGSNGELESSRVGLEIICHLALRGNRQGWRWEAPALQSVVAGWGEQAERVPALAPGVTYPLVGVEDHEGQAPLCQVVPRGETCLTTTDNHRVETLQVGSGPLALLLDVPVHRCLLLIGIGQPTVWSRRRGGASEELPNFRRATEWVIPPIPGVFRRAGARRRRPWPQRARTSPAW